MTTEQTMTKIDSLPYGARVIIVTGDAQRETLSAAEAAGYISAGECAQDVFGSSFDLDAGAWFEYTNGRKI
jgi:hypothetical protein